MAHFRTHLASSPRMELTQSGLPMGSGRALPLILLGCLCRLLPRPGERLRVQGEATTAKSSDVPEKRSFTLLLSTLSGPSNVWNLEPDALKYQ